MKVITAMEDNGPMRSADQLVSEGIKQLTPYVPGKPLEELEREAGITGAIKMASNENPLGPSPRALEAIRQTLASIHRYPDASCYALKQKLSQELGIVPECIVPVNGSNEILELSVKAFLRPGDETIVPEPSFSLYAKFTQIMDAVPVKVPLKDYHLDLENMLRHVSAKTRIIFVNNPNNPTGTVVSRHVFDEFLNAIPEHVIIILDEAYREFVTTPDTPHGEDYLAGPRWVITMRTFSKAYGLAGLRIGYGIAAPELTRFLNKIRQPFNVNLLAQIAASAALDDQVHVQQTLAAVADGLRYFYQELDRAGIPYIPTQANYLMIRVNTSGDAVYQAMLREGVIIRPLTSFGYPDYIRINMGTLEENKRCMAALQKILGDG